MVSNKSIKLLTFAIFATMFLCSFFVILQNKEFFTLEYVLQSYKLMADKISDNYILYYIAFFLLYFFISLFALPLAGILCLLIGALFGFIPGIILASFASSLGALLCFLTARYLFKTFIEQKFAQTLKKINEGIKRDGIFYLFLVRMTPIFPFFLINILFSVTEIKARSFYFTSQVGMLFGTGLFINAGTQLSKINSVEDIFNKYIITSIVLIAVFPLIFKKILESVRK